MIQEVTTSSWGSRIAGAFLGVLVGIALIIGAFVLIFWNENNGLRTSESLQQTLKVLISVPATPINEQNNLKAIYLTGTADTEEVLKDPLLLVSEKAIKLNRHVEMYQWEQKKDTQSEDQFGGSEKQTTTYSYKKVWSEGLIDSSDYKDPTGHQNPISMPFKSKEFQANKVTLGDFTLSKVLINKFNDKTAVNLSSVDLSNIQSKTKLKVQMDDEKIYVGDDPQNPQIGDMRITLQQVLPQTVSVIGQQTGSTVQAYKAPAGREVALISAGEQSPQIMVDDAQRENTILTWVLRLVSLLMMCFGIFLVLSPIAALGKVIPFVGSIMEFGIGIVALVCGLLLWGSATAIAWFVVKPLLAIVFLMAIIGVCYFIIHRKKLSRVD